MKRYHCDKICELGVFKGDNFMRMIAHNPKEAVAIDSWKNAGSNFSSEALYTHEQLKAQYREFAAKVKGMSNVKIIREDTSEAAKHFKDKYFDFVYIDADHSAEGCTKDILAWYPKVKPGKFLVGHDYKRGFGVVEAVDKFVADNKLQLHRLSVSNWMIIKPYFG